MGYGSSGKGEPFRCAVREGLITCHKEVVELLIVNGAYMSPKDMKAQTLLEMTNHPETADLLCKHGGKTEKELEAEEK